MGPTLATQLTVRKSAQSRSSRQTCNREAVARSRRLEPLDHRRRDRYALQRGRVVRIARRPHPRFAAFDRELAVDRDTVANLEARAADFAHLRGALGHGGELGRPATPPLATGPRDPPDAAAASERR